MDDAGLGPEASVRRLPMFPLSTVLFPHEPLPLHVFEPRYRTLTLECLMGDREFGVVLIERGLEVGGGDERVALGTLAYIQAAAPYPDGRYGLLAVGRRRIRVVQWLPDDPYPVAMVQLLGQEAEPVDPDAFETARSAVWKLRALLSELGQAPPLPDELVLDADLAVAAWRVCTLAPLNLIDRQRLLAIEGANERLSILVDLANALGDDLARMLAGG